MKKIIKINTSMIISFIAVFIMTISLICTPLYASAESNISVNSATLETFDDNSLQESGQPVQSVFENQDISSCEYLYNLDDSADYIYVEFEKGGYALLTYQTMELMEYSLQGKLPYSDNLSKKYYAGPSNYLYKNDNQFVNAITGEKIAINKSDINQYANNIRTNIINTSTFNYGLNDSAKYLTNNLSDLYAYKYDNNSDDKDLAPDIDSGNLINPPQVRSTLIPNSNYFTINPTHGRNFGNETYGNGNTGTCGPVAAQILLGYNNYYNDRRIIEDRYLNGYDDVHNTVSNPELNPNHCSDPMTMTRQTIGTRSENTGDNSFYSKVVTSIMKPNTDGSSLSEVCSGIKKILNENLISSDYTIDKEEKLLSSIKYDTIKSEIDAGRPLILSMSDSLGGINHDIVAYGYENYSYPNSSEIYTGYIVHFGWQNRNCIWVNSSWCDGFITLAMNHEHNYFAVGIINNTSRTEYRCRDCGHRTDRAPNNVYLDIIDIQKSGSSWKVRVANPLSTSIDLSYNTKMCYYSGSGTIGNYKKELFKTSLYYYKAP